MPYLMIGSTSRVDFCLFDKVRARADGQNVDLGSEKERSLIAALLLAKGRSISRSELLDWLWEDAPPKSAGNDLDRHMTKLRKRLDGMGLKEVLINRDGQSRLEIPPEWVDVHRFRALVAEARILEDAEAADRLRLALELSEGEPLAGLPGLRFDANRQGLVEDRRNAELEFLRLEMKLGRHRQHLADLTRLHRDRPGDVEVAGLTMYALHLVGRQADALEIYSQHRAYLVEQGFEVSQQIRDLQTRILGGAGTEDFLPPEPNQDQAGEKESRTATPQVINKIKAPVTGGIVVFGVNNQVRP